MKEIRILLIGRTGHGKSSVGNTLLGREAFPVSPTSQSCTSTCDFQETDRDNVRVVVVDTPGIFDTHIPKLGLMRELIKTVLYTTPGFHVIAFVLRPDRFTEELQQTQQLFFEWFGGNVREYACLIFTHCKSRADVEHYIHEPHRSLRALLEACDQAVLPFENTASLDIKETQVRDFMQHVTVIIDNNKGRHFSNLALNIATAYAQNRDLQTISNDSIVLLQSAGYQFVRDSVQSFGLMDENTASGGGNLNIIYVDDDPRPTEPQSCKDIPLLDFASENVAIPSPSVAQKAVKPKKSSTRAGRILVNESETDSTSSGHRYSNQEPVSTTRINQGPSNSATIAGNQPSLLYSRSSEVCVGSATSVNFNSVRPSANLDAPLNQPSTSSATSATASLHQPSDGSMRPDVFKNTSDEFQEFREGMRNDENVNAFVNAIVWIWGKIKDMGRNIRNFFSCGGGGNYNRI